MRWLRATITSLPCERERARLGAVQLVDRRRVDVGQAGQIDDDARVLTHLLKSQMHVVARRNVVFAGESHDRRCRSFFHPADGIRPSGGVLLLGRGSAMLRRTRRRRPVRAKPSFRRRPLDRRVRDGLERAPRSRRARARSRAGRRAAPGGRRAGGTPGSTAPLQSSAVSPAMPSAPVPASSPSSDATTRTCAAAAAVCSVRRSTATSAELRRRTRGRRVRSRRAGWSSSARRRARPAAAPPTGPSRTASVQSSSA